MNNSTEIENTYESNLKSNDGLIESHNAIGNNYLIDSETTLTVQNKWSSDKNCNDESRNDNIVGNNTQNETKNSKSTLNDEQKIMIDSCESISQSQSDVKTDNEQMSAIKTVNKDVNKNINMQNESQQFLEMDTSVVDGSVALVKSTSQEFEELNRQCEPSVDNDVSCSDHIYNDSNILVSDNSSSRITETAGSQNQLCDKININPTPNDFGMVNESALLNASSFNHDSMRPTDVTLPSSDNSIVISNSNAVPQSDSIVSSNYSLSQLTSYGSDESLNEESHEVTTKYRDTKIDVDLSDKDSDSDSSSTSSSSSIIISDSSDSESDCEYENVTSVAPKPIKAKGELDLNDLPPIEDLKISVPEEDCSPVGQVFQIVDQLVVIQAIKDMPALNLDTVLFLQGGQPFGKIFDVFGPVKEPYYCVRFNSKDHIKEKKICLNQMVYCAPKTKYTKYVFLAQLMKLKGSDASWENDIEPPEIYLEYSDDEQEQRAKKKASRNKKAAAKQHSDPDEPARKKHFSYEKKMNKRNLQLSASRRKSESRKLENSSWGRSATSSDIAASRYSSFSDVPHQIFGRPPVFTARVPSPNVGRFLPSRSDMFPPRPDMFSPSPDTVPPRPNVLPPRPNMFPPRPDMFQPRSNMFPPRPDMNPPRPYMFPPRPDMFPPRPDMFPPRPDMFSPRSPMLPPRSTNFPGLNNQMHSPLNSFQSPPPSCAGPNAATHYSQGFQPRISPGPFNNAQSFSPLASPRFCDGENNHRLRNSYPSHPGSPHHGNLPTGNLWMQRPHSPSLGSVPPNYWPSSRPNNTSQINPHAPSTSNPF